MPKKIWVYENTGRPYMGLLPKDLTENKKKHTFQLEDSSEWVTIEHIREDRAKNRESIVWVSPPGSYLEYKGDFPPDWEGNRQKYEVFLREKKIPPVFEFTLENSEKSIRVEQISKRLWQDRKDLVWVTPPSTFFSVDLTVIPEDCMKNPENYQPSYDNKNHIKTICITTPYSQNPITLECITKDSFHRRKRTFFFSDSHDGLQEFDHATLPQNWYFHPENYEASYSRTRYGNILEKLKIKHENQVIDLFFLSRLSKKTSQKPERHKDELLKSVPPKRNNQAYTSFFHEFVPKKRTRESFEEETIYEKPLQDGASLLPFSKEILDYFNEETCQIEENVIKK